MSRDRLVQTELLRLTKWSPSREHDTTKLRVAYRPRELRDPDEPKARAYDVLLDDAVIGFVETAPGTMPGANGRRSWAWERPDGTCNEPGVFVLTRADAVANLLGWDWAEKA